MPTITKKSITTTPPVQSISSVVGSPPILPGESVEEYQKGLQSVIEELEAETVMQVYLAEKIFDCLWWMRRYEQIKRTTMARSMTQFLTGVLFYKFEAEQHNIMDLMLDPSRTDELNEVLKESDHSALSLMQDAFAQKVRFYDDINNQIAMFAKMLAGFQASYEVLVNRKLHIERLRLNNEMLARDLDAVEVEALPDVTQS